MPLNTLANDQINELKAFLFAPGKTLLCLRHDPDAKHILIKVLLGMQDDDDLPHLLAYSDIAFGSPLQFFTELLQELVEANEQQRSVLEAEGVQLPRPIDDERLRGVLRRPTADELFLAQVRLATYLSQVADCMPPDRIGAYAVVLDPASVADPTAYAQAIRYLAEHTKSDWVKYLALDNRRKPLLATAEQSERTVVLDFHLGPERIEAELNRDLRFKQLPAPERRQYLAMAGVFAFARGELPKALQLQTEALQLAEQGGSPTEQANALYNLGNTHLKNKQLAEAEDHFVRAAQLCVEHQLHPLLATVLSNLGVTLHRAGRVDEALQSLEVARRTYAAINNPPGAAYALDNKAALLAVEKRNAEAEQAWLEALAVYDGITGPTFAELQASGREDILGKLERWYAATGQKDKLKALQRKAVPAS